MSFKSCRFLCSLFVASIVSFAFGQANTWPISPSGYTQASTYSFLPPLLRDVDIVSLGESIHMTHEFPLVRLGIIKELNQNLGFHTVAFEGSPVDLWVTQDRFLASGKQEQDVKEAMSGLFRIWNTAEIEQLFAYEAASWSSAQPLYITSYDIQPGLGIGTPHQQVFTLLSQRLRTYAEPPAGFNQAAWLRDIDRTRCPAGVTPQDAAANRAIDQLQQWIQLALPQVQSRYPNLPHATILQLIPGNLRRSLNLCPPPGLTYWDIVGTVREQQASQYTLELQRALPDAKLMLWAHLHHAGYFPGSVATRLRTQLGLRLYSLGVLSDGGSAIVIYSDRNDDVGYTWLHPARGALRTWLDRHGPGNLYVNLHGNPDPVFAAPVEIQYESGILETKLPQLINGAIWIRRVHPPHYPPGVQIFLSVWHVRYEIAALAVALLAALGIFLAWRFRKRRRRGTATALHI